jgi:hypothetical protein
MYRNPFIFGNEPEPVTAPVPSPISPDALLTEAQAGRIAGVSRKQIRKMILAGRLEAVDWGTGKRKHYRIKAEALAKLNEIKTPAACEKRRSHSRVSSPAGGKFVAWG